MPAIYQSLIALSAIVWLTTGSHPARAVALPESGSADALAAVPNSTVATRVFPAPRQGEPKWSWLLLGGTALSACRHDLAADSASTACGAVLRLAEDASIDAVYPVTRQVTWLWAWIHSDDGRLRVCRAPGIAGRKARPACSQAAAMSQGARVRSVRPVDRAGAGQWAWIIDEFGGLRVCRFNSTSDSVHPPVCSESMTGARKAPIDSVHSIVQTGGTQPAWVVYEDGAVGVCGFKPTDELPAEILCAAPVMPADGATKTH